MAINFDHTNSANITLKGPSNGNLGESFTFQFPNVQNTEANLLISGETPIAAISGLTAALSEKVERNITGNAIALDYGTSVGNLVRLDENGKIPNSLISSVAIRDVFEVTNFSELTSNSSASIGDIGIVSADHKNYILCSSGENAYATCSNWKEVLFPVQIVTSVNSLCGDVVLDGSNVCIKTSPAAYAGYSVDYAIDDLKTVKADLACLIDYATTGYVYTCLGCYSTSSQITTCLLDYETTSALSTTLSSYSTTSQITTTLTDYVLNSSTGSAAHLNVGTSAGNVVQLNGFGKIEPSLMPSIAVNNVFVINASGELTSLSTAHVGDIAVATGSHYNYILSGQDPTVITEWVQFATNLGTVQSVNGQSPVDGAVTLTSDDFLTCHTSTQYDNSSVTYAISGLNIRVSGIEADYLTEGEASNMLLDYVLTGTATGIFNSKSDVGHTHVISDVNGLGSCLSAITAFHTGAGNYSVQQIGANPGFNEALGDYSVALGYGAKAVQDYEIAHASNYFSAPGDAQSSKLVAKSVTANDTLTTIAEVCLENYSNVLISSYVVGKTASTNRYAAFKIDTSVNREGGAATVRILEGVAENVYANTSGMYAVVATANTDDGKIDIQVSGDATDGMYWVASTTTVKVLVD